MNESTQSRLNPLEFKANIEDRSHFSREGVRLTRGNYRHCDFFALVLFALFSPLKGVKRKYISVQNKLD